MKTTRDEYAAFGWQMLLSLCLDNKIKPPKMLYDNGIKATEYLMTYHASEFTYPSRRRSALKRFIQRAKKLGHQ